METLSDRTALCSAGDTLLLHVLEGDGMADARVIAEGDTLILSAAERVSRDAIER